MFINLTGLIFIVILRILRIKKNLKILIGYLKFVHSLLLMEQIIIGFIMEKTQPLVISIEIDRIIKEKVIFWP